MRREPPYKKLAAELSEQGIDSVYLARVRARVDPEQELRSLENEIAGEIAKALGRTEDQLNLALAELELAATRLSRLREQAAPRTELEAAVLAFNSQRTTAEKRFRDLVIHREAAGFRRNQVLYELYPIPRREKP